MPRRVAGHSWGPVYSTKGRTDGAPTRFRLTDNFQYGALLTVLHKGDSVSIYYRKRLMVLLGVGRQTDTYHLEHQGSVLFDLKQRKRNSRALAGLRLGVSLVLGVLLYRRQGERRTFLSQTDSFASGLYMLTVAGRSTTSKNTTIKALELGEQG